MPNLLRRDRRLLALLTLTAVLLATSAVSALASSPGPVKVADNYYGLKKLTVNRGTNVTWKWAGVLRHNVVVRTGPAQFRSRIQVAGSFSHPFTTRGTYQLFCTLHTFMKMTIVVK